MELFGFQHREKCAERKKDARYVIVVGARDRQAEAVVSVDENVLCRIVF